MMNLVLLKVVKPLYVITTAKWSTSPQVTNSPYQLAMGMILSIYGISNQPQSQLASYSTTTPTAASKKGLCFGWHTRSAQCIYS